MIPIVANDVCIQAGSSYKTFRRCFSRIDRTAGPLSLCSRMGIQERGNVLCSAIIPSSSPSHIVSSLSSFMQLSPRSHSLRCDLITLIFFSHSLSIRQTIIELLFRRSRLESIRSCSRVAIPNPLRNDIGTRSIIMRAFFAIFTAVLAFFQVAAALPPACLLAALGYVESDLSIDLSILGWGD